MLLTREQRIGATILFGFALIAWIITAVWPSRNVSPAPPSPVQPDSTHSPKKYRTWEERKDSMRRVDSIRYAQWAAERQLRYDSFRIADSLWRDSVGWHYPKRIKKDTVIDLNHCDTTDLMYIRGIGRYTAIQIIRYREELGGYYSPSQLTDEPFARCRLDSLLASFTADTAELQRIHVNTCSIERLQRHPYIRFKQAKELYTHRRRQGRLSSVEDLRDLPYWTDDDLRRIAPYLSFE